MKDYKENKRVRRSSARFPILRLFLVSLVILLSGCKKELYSDLSEKEGNDMLSILLEQGIDVEKVRQQKGGLVTLMVEGDELSKSIKLLRQKGFPRDQFTSVGELFQKDGLISSPLEERARYIFGLSQEVAETLSQLDGVITARVHVVMPETKERKQPSKPASASVFIKYSEHTPLDDFVPQIKMLVNNSIEGLDYDNISVALFPSANQEIEAHAQYESFLFLSVASHSVTRFYLLLGFIIILLGGLFAYAVLISRRAKQNALVEIKAS